MYNCSFSVAKSFNSTTVSKAPRLSSGNAAVPTRHTWLPHTFLIFSTRLRRRRCCRCCCRCGGASLNVRASNKECVHVLYSALLFLSDAADPAFVISSWLVFDQEVSLWIMPKYNLATEWIFGSLFVSSCFYFYYYCFFPLAAPAAVIARRLTGARVSDLIFSSPSVLFINSDYFFFIFMFIMIQKWIFARMLS